MLLHAWQNLNYFPDFLWLPFQTSPFFIYFIFLVLFLGFLFIFLGFSSIEQYVFICDCWFQLLELPGPFPMVVVPQTGGYWVDGSEPLASDPGSANQHLVSSLLPSGEGAGSSGRSTPRLEVDETAKCYRRYFLDRVSHCLHLIWLAVIIICELVFGDYSSVNKVTNWLIEWIVD